MKKKASKKSGSPGIKWRLLACFGAFIAFVLLVLWMFQVIFLEDFYQMIKIAEIERSTKQIKSVMLSDDFSSELAEISSRNEVCILITDENGETVAGCDYLAGCIIHHISAESKVSLIKSAKETGHFVEQFNLNDFAGRRNASYDVSMISVTEYNFDGNDYYIFVNAKVTPVNATVQTLRIQIFVITAILIVFGAVIAYFFARFISKPIMKLNESAKELAKGNYKADFGKAIGYREIDELADSLGYASSELAKVDNLKDELIANISHDLRTPLTLISGYAEVMRDIPDEKTAENLQIIIDETARLNTLVSDLLDVSKLRSDNIKLNITAFDLTETLRNTINRYQKMVEKEGFTFELICDGSVTVNADETRISQVIYNLINNAVIHAGEDKKVTVEQKIGESFVTVGIIDTGDGIPESELKNIWDRYYRISETHKRAITGSGLGLSIVNEVIRLHNETVPDSAYCGVKSEVGKGSTFWFALRIK